MNKTAKWIWKNGFEGKDLYCDFYSTFSYHSGKVILRLSADSNYALYINGQFAESGQYADYPHYKVYDELDISKFCQVGINHLAITVWYYGKASLCYYPGNPALYFEVFCEDQLVACSNEQTLCRQSREYQSGLCKLITSQLGYSFHYDITGYDDWRTGALDGFEPAAQVAQTLPLHKRPIHKLAWAEKKETKLLLNENNTHFLFDLGQEEVGYLTIKLQSPKKQRILIAYGEHLLDGCVRRRIRTRDFSVEVTVAEGETTYINPFRRLGLRYLEVFCAQPIQPEYITVTPVYYPLKKTGMRLADTLDQKIYDTCVRTLELCMHEHYEDCPWREQAFYCLDSRNQMLCGYYCFEEYDFARACIRLMSQDNRYDGLLSLCFPSGNYRTEKGISIPSFSLHYFTQVREYMEHTGDKALVEEIYPKLLSVMKTFTDRIEDGCVKSFTGKEHWNFYEWRPGLGGHLDQSDEEAYEAALNCLLVIALRNMAYLSTSIGREDRFSHLIPPIIQGIRKRFLNSETGFFYNREDEDSISELVNSLCILADVCTDREAKMIAEAIVRGGSPMTPVTLSMLCFKYDALLKVDPQAYKPYILNEIRAKYKHMLDEGATTFWETEDATKTPSGSLCHGWSALPVYYYETFERGKPSSALY